MDVGYIGLGNIGGAMARQLIRPPFQLIVHDANEAAMRSFAGIASLAASPIEVARNADVIGVCVRDEDDVRAVFTGPEGLLAGVRKNAVILIHSTISPIAAEELATLAQSAGAMLLDAAVTGGAQAAQNRSVCVMIGGEGEALERARPFLDAFCSRIVHAGPVGRGMALKLCNNLVFFMQVRAVNEGFRLAEAAGLATQLREVMTENGNLTALTQLYIDFRQHGKAQVGETAFKHQNSQMCGLAEKDLDLALEYAARFGLALGGAQATRSLMKDAFES